MERRADGTVLLPSIPTACSSRSASAVRERRAPDVARLHADDPGPQGVLRG